MNSKQWRTYEDVARHLVDRISAEFGIDRIEDKSAVTGQTSGTEWEIDAKGVRSDGETFVIIEARRYTKKRLDQESIGAIAYRIHDTGAAGAIVVSPLGFQEGAKKVAAAENIVEVTLSPDSTMTDYMLAFLNQVHVGISERIMFSDSVSYVATHRDGTIERG